MFSQVFCFFHIRPPENQFQIESKHLKQPWNGGLTSHDSPNWADEMEDLGFDSWIISEPSDSLIDPPADWGHPRGTREKGDRRKHDIRHFISLT